MRLQLSGIAVLAICLVPPLVCAQALDDKFFDSNGVRIRYVDQGTGEPIVLLHGQGNNVDAAWVRTGVLANLATDHRVIAMDLRGHGKSGKPHKPEAYGEEMGLDVLRLLDHLTIQKAHVLGYSLGAGVNAKLLVTPPFRAFILRNASPDRPPTEAQMREISQRMLQTIDPLAMAAFARSRERQVVTNAEIAAIRIPTLGLVGGADPRLAGVKELKAVMPSLTVVVIEGATHSSADERGAPRRPEFAKAIREFVAAHRPTNSR